MSDYQSDENLTLAESIRRKIAGLPTKTVEQKPMSDIEEPGGLQSMFGNRFTPDGVSNLKNLQPLSAGDIVGELFKVLSGPVEGHNVDVYQAQNIRLPIPVALRILKPEQTANHTDREHFHNELQLQSSLSNNNMVSCLDFVIEPNGRMVHVQQFIAGVTFENYLSRNDGVAEAHFLNLFAQLCDALSYLHARNLVYLSINHNHFLVTMPKPRNTTSQATSGEAGALEAPISPVLKMIDFNRVQSKGAYQSREQSLEQLFSRCHYPSPEQLNNGVVDERSDVYGLGCLLYRLVIGKDPFVASAPESLKDMHLSSQPEPVSIANPSLKFLDTQSLQRSVFKAMSKSPEHRYQSVNELLEDLRVT